MAKISHYGINKGMRIYLTDAEYKMLNNAERITATVHPGSPSEFVRLSPDPKGKVGIYNQEHKTHKHRIHLPGHKGVRSFAIEEVKLQQVGGGVIALAKPTSFSPPKFKRPRGSNGHVEVVSGKTNGVAETNELDNIFQLQDRLNLIKQTLGNNMVFSVREDGTLRITMDR